MKICHITNEHRSDDPRIFHKMCTSLAKNTAYEVSLIAPGEDRVENEVRVIGVGNLRVTSGKSLPAKIWRKSFELLALDKRLLLSRIYRKALAVDADVYHLHDIHLLRLGKTLKKRGYKVVFDSHEDYVAISSAGTLYLLKLHGILQIILANRLLLSMRPYKRLLTRIHHYFFERYHDQCCRMFDAIVYVTPGRFFDHLLTLNQRTVLVTNYPLTKHTPDPDHFPDYESKKAVFAGGILPYWNHDTVIGAIEHIPGAKYVLCGYTTEQYLSKLKTLPGWKKVDFLGRVPYEQVPIIMKTAAVGIAVYDYWSNTEWEYGSYGIIKIFEYMQAALPVVCTDFTLWKQIVDEHQCGIYVNPDDADGIRTAIDYLINHPDEARRMGENGRRAIIERFNWESEEAKLLALYGSLA